MDARLFFDLALERGFVAPALLESQQATRAAVRAHLVEMAALCESGDLFLLTFSGHGGQTRLPSGEVGTWQLYDGTLNEEQLRADLAQFRRGVRVLIVSDNCGGGIPRGPQSPGGSERNEERSDAECSGAERTDAARSGAGRSSAAWLEDAPLSRPAIEGFLKASVLVLAACEQGKYADGAGLPGHFTAAIKRTLNCSGTYDAFHQALCHEMPSYQKPDYYRLGASDPTFEAQQPLTI
jgi:metacaspase-1